MRQFSNFLLPLPILCLLCSCATSTNSQQTPMHPVQQYENAMRELPGASFAPGSSPEKAAIQRFKDFFARIDEENVRQRIAETYAEEVFFFDTLKVLRTREDLKEYFLETAKNTDSVHATVLDVARSGDDYYLRWVMDVELKKFRRGTTLRSVGMTHLRFNDEGQIILHHDYWDSAAGFYEHVPVVGAVIRYIRSLF